MAFGSGGREEMESLVSRLSAPLFLLIRRAVTAASAWSPFYWGWRAAGAKFHEWSTRALAPERAPRKGETLVRLVTSFETASSEIDRLLELCAGVPASAAAAQ
jgi:hypothetical protein